MDSFEDWLLEMDANKSFSPFNLDKDNIVFALKWIADTLETLGYVKDDKIINFHSFDTIVDTSLPETMFEIQITTDELKWVEE
jgi:hypothetical protein